jgi:hypothetical protein
VVGLVLTQVVLSNQFGSKIDGLSRRLTAGQLNGAASPQPPANIRAYALRNGGRVGGPSTVAMVQAAEMRLAPGQPFFSLHASQISGTRTPGFVWQASGRMSGLIPLRILDSYVDGIGLLEVRIGGSAPIASSTGKETAKGEAMRFLAELPWNPDAILNAGILMWREIDSLAVAVSMNTVGGLAEITLRLNQAGDVIAVDAEARPRAGDTPARWVGRFGDYVRVGSYRFPRHGEIAWDLPEGEFIYWRGEILSLTGN